MRKVKQSILELGPKKAPQTVVESGETGGIVVSSESNIEKQLESALTCPPRLAQVIC